MFSVLEKRVALLLGHQTLPLAPDTRENSKKLQGSTPSNTLRKILTGAGGTAQQCKNSGVKTGRLKNCLKICHLTAPAFAAINDSTL